MTDRTCGTCRFWQEGQCRRFPPSHFHALSGGHRFIATESSAWCGEHQKKPGRRSKRDDGE